MPTVSEVQSIVVQAKEGTYKLRIPTLGRGEEAEAYYLKAMEIEPELDDTYKNLAIYYQGEGIHEKALHYFRLYDERKPNDKIVIAGIASIHERRGEHDEGMALIKPFIESDDNDANSPGAEIIIAYAKLARHFKQEDHAIELFNSINDDSIIIHHSECFSIHQVQTCWIKVTTQTDKT